MSDTVPQAFEAWALLLLGDNPAWRNSADCELAWQAWQAAIASQAPAAIAEPAMTRAQAVSLARSAAVARPDGHKYIPSGKLPDDWQPHEWVVDAILAANRCAAPIASQASPAVSGAEPWPNAESMKRAGDKLAAAVAAGTAMPLHGNAEDMWVAQVEAERPSGASPAAVEALRELVACKDLKDAEKAVRLKHYESGITDDYRAAKALRGDYERRQPLAWEAARAALASQPATEPRDAILARMVVLAPYTSFLGAYENEWRELIASAAEPPSTQPYLNPDAGFPFPVPRRAETDLEAIGREYSVDLTGQPEDGILFVDGGTKRNE